MKPNTAVMLRRIHSRALWNALRSSGGDADAAAKALGITAEELIALLARDPAELWSNRNDSSTSGTRRITPVAFDPPNDDEEND